MDMKWPNTQGKTITGRIEAAYWPAVKALGIDGAANFYLKFGGTYVRFDVRSMTERNALVKEFGKASAEALVKAFEEEAPRANYRVPLASKFLARYLRSQGHNVSAICSRLRKTDGSIMSFLKKDAFEQKHYRDQEADDEIVWPKTAGRDFATHKQVADLISAGLSTADVAAKLGISPKRVQYLDLAYRKRNDLTNRSRKRKSTIEQENEANRHYLAGLSPQEIADRMGIKKSLVFQLRRNHRNREMVAK